MEDLKEHIKLDKAQCEMLNPNHHSYNKFHVHAEQCQTSIEKIRELKNKKKDDAELTA